MPVQWLEDSLTLLPNRVGNDLPTVGKRRWAPGFYTGIVPILAGHKLPLVFHFWSADVKKRIALEAFRGCGAHAFIKNLELTGFINMNIHDGSSLVQASADYYLSTLGPSAFRAVPTLEEDTVTSAVFPKRAPFF